MKDHDFDRLINLDFNLIRTLSLLLKNRSIAKSAEQLCRGQSAISKQLTRLREMFDDELLVRVGNDHTLTPKAKRLQPLADNVCAQVKELMISQSLDLKATEATVSIILSDYASPHWMTNLVKLLSKEAPKVKVVCNEWSETNIAKLISGDIDYALGPIKQGNANCSSQHVATHSHSYLARPNHPLFKEENKDNLSNYPIVQTSGSTQYQNLYSKVFKDNHVILDQASLLLAVETVKNTDALLIGPTIVMEELADKEDLKSNVIKKMETTEVILSWNAGLNSNPFYQWLTSRILEIGRNFLI